MSCTTIFCILCIFAIGYFIFRFFRKHQSASNYIESEYEQSIRQKYKDSWIAVNENDPALETVLNAAWNSKEPVCAVWDDKNGLQKK